MEKLRIMLIVLALVGLGGCARYSAEAYVEIYQLGAEGGYGLFGDVVAGGCLMYSKGALDGIHFAYESDKCNVEINPEPLPMSGDL